MRLFFALWPDESAARALEEAARKLAAEAGGKAVPLEKIHLTLAFLGEVPPGRLEAARAAAAACRCHPFNAVFDCVGAFRAAGVAWIGMREPPAELTALQARLCRELRQAGFVLEERPFSPHITLVRRVARRVGRRNAAPIAWAAREFSLVRSETGTGRYSRLATWELAG